MAEQQPTSFNITWKSGAYYVDIPNYQGGKVYTAEVVDALVAALKACGSVTKAYAGDGLLTQIDAVLALANGVSAPSHDQKSEAQ